MHTERIVVLISPEEKGRLQQAARANKQSLGEFVRSVLSREDARAASADAEVHLSKEQRDALEDVAQRASAALQRGNRALDRAFAEIAMTRAHFSKSANAQFLPERAVRMGRKSATGVAIKSKAAVKPALGKVARTNRAIAKPSKA
jgi:uncharacterized protein (DUF1778 family)